MSENLSPQGVDQPDSPFATCPACGVLVQVRRWVNKVGWKELAIPESAALGSVHGSILAPCVIRKETAC